MARVTSQKTRQFKLILDEAPDPNTPIENLALFDADNNPIVISGNVGIPVGGDVDQVLTKVSGESYDVDWVDAPSGIPLGGTADQVLAKLSSSDLDVGWVDPLSEIVPVIQMGFDGPLDDVVPILGTSLTGLLVEDGVLKSTDSLNHEFVHETVSLVDSKQMLKINGTGSGNFTFYIMHKYIDEDNWIMTQYAGGSNLLTYRCIAGSLSQIDSMSMSLYNTSWIVTRMIGNMIHIERYTQDPRFGASPQVQDYHELSVGDRAVFGAGISGKPGLRLTGNGGVGSTATTLDDWVVVDLSAPPSPANF